MPTTRNLAILIFEDVEVLDFCGPFEVFSVAIGDLFSLNSLMTWKWSSWWTCGHLLSG